MCAHGLVRTEAGEGGSHYDPMWFHTSLFSGIDPASKRAHDLSEPSDWQPGWKGGDDINVVETTETMIGDK